MSAKKTRKPCILVADDDAGIRSLLNALLTEEGFHVLSAVNGAAALDEARKYRGDIDLLITDVQMPKLDGFDLQERLRLERPDIKLLVISGALEANIEGTDFPLLRKPFRSNELKTRVREILGKPAALPN
jgi:DNA-binding response OmpR family regulator